MTELELLQRQNRILRNLLRTLATVVEETLAVLPPEYQQLDNVKRAQVTTRNIITHLESTEYVRPNKTN
jgi:hypothetical protein